jgi:hypothetical protein
MRTLSGLRDALNFAYQKAKLPSLNPAVLRQNYTELAEQMLVKASFLLVAGSVLQERDAFRDVAPSQRCAGVYRFSLGWSTEGPRARTRFLAMDTIEAFLAIPDLFHTARVTFLSPLLSGFPGVSNRI